MQCKRNGMQERITPEIEKLLELKLFEIDKNLFFSVAFEEILPNVSGICDKISEESAEDTRDIIGMLLKNKYNPTVRLNSSLTSIDLSEDTPSKAPYTAVSVINYNISEKKKICAFIRSLLARDVIRKLDTGYETLNRVYLKELRQINELSSFLNN